MSAAAEEPGEMVINSSHGAGAGLVIATHTSADGQVHLLHAPEGTTMLPATSNIIHTAMMHASATDVSPQSLASSQQNVDTSVVHGTITDSMTGHQEVVQIPMVQTITEEQMVVQDEHGVLHIAHEVDATQVHDTAVDMRQTLEEPEQAELVVEEATPEKEQNQGSHAANSVDMMDFMDVITSYKCKFCGYSSQSPNDISSHVQSAHMSFEGGARLVVNEERTQSASAGTQTSEPPSVDINTKREKSSSVEADAEQEGSKELYLCGQCSLDFSNIDDCKNHMIKDHNISISALEEQPQDFPQDAGYQPNKVSVGTQVVKKKVGRKRKIEVKEEEIILKDGANDKEDSSSDIEIMETSGKRKVRPPKALTQLYVLNKRKASGLRLNTRDYRLACPKNSCMARFKTPSVLELHKSCHVNLTGAPKNGKPYICPTCAEGFNQWKILRMHLWRQHKIDTDLLACTQCEFKTDTVHRLESHLEIHQENKGYPCEVCGKAFKQRRQLANHKVLHCDRSPEGDHWYCNKQCDICKRIFANAKCLKTHIKAVHGKDKPFQCPYCGHATARKAMMELHVRTHTGEKPFKCDLCPYATGDHNSLRRHKMRHTGSKPYRCPHCQYSCIQAISLKTHMKNKHPGAEGVYACDVCQYRTVSKSNWENHIEDHKNGLVPTNNVNPQEAPERATQSKVSSASGNLPQQIHIQSTSGEPISTIDLSKISSQAQELGQSDLNAAQLIYTALNAISQTPGGVIANDGNGQELHPVVDSSTEDGVTTHTITFHIGGDTNQQTIENVGSDSEELVVAVESASETQTVEETIVEQEEEQVVVAGQPEQLTIEATDGSTQQLTMENVASYGQIQEVQTDSEQQAQVIHAINMLESGNAGEIIVTPVMDGDLTQLHYIPVSTENHTTHTVTTAQ